MRKVVTQILFVFLMIIASSGFSFAQGTLTTNNLTPTPVCQGSTLQLEFVSTIDMSSITTLEVKFFKGAALVDSVDVNTTFDVSPFKQDVQFVTIPATVFGSGITVRAYFVDDSLSWTFAASPAFTVLPTPTVNSASSKTICSNNTVSYTITSLTLNASFTWTASELTPPTGGNITGFSDCASGCGNIIGQTLVNSGTSTGVVRYVITPTGPSPAFCPGTPFNFDVTVQPVAVVQATPPSATICGGTGPGINLSSSTTGSVNYVWTASLISGTATGFSSSNGSTINQTLSNSTNSPATVRYVVTPRIGAANCPGTPINVDVIVNPKGNVTQPLNQVVCNSAPTSVSFSTANTGGTTTFAWTNSNPSIGLAANGNGDISFTASNTGTAPISGTIVVTPTFTNGATSCVGSSKTFTITVNPDGQVNQPVSQVKCNNSNTTGITFSTLNTGGSTTYSWTNDQPSIGLAASGSGTIPAFNAVNNGTSPVVATIVVTPSFTNGGTSCNGPTKTFSITVNPTGQVNQPSNQVLCDNTNTTNILFGTNNSGGTTTYSWTNNTPSIGLPASGSGDILAFTATNSGRVAKTATIVVTPTFSFGATSCQGPTKTFTIIVNPTPKALMIVGTDTTIGGRDTICSNAAVTFMINTDSSSVLSNSTNGMYWSITINPLLSGSTQILSGNRVSKFTNTLLNNDPSNSVQSVEYTFYPVSKDGCSPALPVKDTVFVRPVATFGAGNVVSHDPACSGIMQPIVLNLPPNSHYTYSVSGDTSIHNIGAPPVSSTSPTINDALTSSNHAIPQTITYLITITADNSLSGCPTSSFPIQKIVNPEPILTVTNPSFYFCSDSSMTFVVNSTTNDNSFSLSTPSLGSGISTLDPINTQVFSNAIQITHKLNNSNPTTASSLTYPISTITSHGCVNNINFTPSVFSSPVVTQVSSNICSSTSTAISLTSSTTGTSTFTWTRLSNVNLDLNSSAIATNGTTTSSINQFLVDSSSVNQASVDYHVFARSDKGCKGATNIITQVVNPSPRITTTQPSAFCNDGFTSISLTASPILGTNTFTWNIVDSSNVNLPAISSGTNSSIIQQLHNTTDNLSGYIKYKVIPTSTITGLSCVGKPDTLTQIVNPIPTLSASPTFYFCSDSTQTFSIASTTTGNTFSASISSLGANLTPGTLTLSTSTTGDSAKVTQKFIESTHNVASNVTYLISTTNGNGCAATLSYVPDVNPAPLVIETVPDICSNTSTSISLNSSTLGGSTFTWTRDTPNNIDLNGSSLIDNGITNNFINQVLVDSSHINAASFDYHVYAISNMGCKGVTKNFTQTINPRPVLTTTPPIPFCSDGTTSINLTASTISGTNTFTWSVIDTNNVNMPLISSGNGSSIIQSLHNFTNNAEGDVKYQVIPTSFMTLSCVGPASTLTQNVHPKPEMNVASPKAICSDDTTKINLTATTDSTGASTFIWGVLDTFLVNTPSPTSGTTGNILQVLHNTSSIDSGFVRYFVTPTSSFSCVGQLDTILQTVHPTPTLSSPLTKTICSGEELIYNATSSTPGSSIISWHLNDNPAMFKRLSGTSSSILTDSNSNIIKTFIKTVNDVTGSVLKERAFSRDTSIEYVFLIKSNKSCTSQNTATDKLQVVIHPTPDPIFIVSDSNASNVCRKSSYIRYEMQRVNYKGDTIRSSVVDPNETVAWVATGGDVYQSKGLLSNACLIACDTNNSSGIVNVFVSSQFNTPNSCSISNSDTTESFNTDATSNPKVILKGYINSDSVLICLANNIDNSFGYNWGRTDTLTLLDDRFEKEKGQEYHLKAEGNVLDRNYFYWCEIKLENDPCERRLYVEGNFPNQKQETTPIQPQEINTELSVYPNPAMNELNLEILNYEIGVYTFVLYDLVGNKMVEGEMKGTKQRISLDKLPRGCYIINCKKDGVNLSSQKILKY